jgi:hypothetical protein
MKIGSEKAHDGPSTRTVSINLAQLQDEQKRYAADVMSKGSVVQFDGRQWRAFSVRPPVNPGPVQPGRKGELIPYRGSPPLDPEEEKRLINNCLMIKGLCVVEDAKRTTGRGVWTFGELMTRLANEKETGIKPAQFVRRWLEQWETDQKINDYWSKERPAVKTYITDKWPKVPGGTELDLTRAPFRLLALVNRVDLRNNLVLGAERVGGGGAGEARFIFGATSAEHPDDQPLDFAVIFEYGIKKNDFEAVRDWASQWYALKALDLGSPAYNDALQRITDQFLDAGADPESPPNYSALSQLRTIENLQVLETVTGAPWECREFRLDAQNEGYLRQVTVKQTPDLAFNKKPTLAEFVRSHEEDILAQRPLTQVVLPDGSHFLGASALIDKGMFWGDVPKTPARMDPEARHLFSLGTCNGCHAGETGTDFRHVRGRAKRMEARLSGFLLGTHPDNTQLEFELHDPAGQTDPHTGKVITRKFKDLLRRALDLRDLMEYGSYYELHRLPPQKAH